METLWTSVVSLTRDAGDVLRRLGVLDVPEVGEAGVTVLGHGDGLLHAHR